VILTWLIFQGQKKSAQPKQMYEISQKLTLLPLLCSSMLRPHSIFDFRTVNSSDEDITTFQTSKRVVCNVFTELVGGIEVISTSESRDMVDLANKQLNAALSAHFAIMVRCPDKTQKQMYAHTLIYSVP